MQLNLQSALNFSRAFGSIEFVDRVITQLGVDVLTNSLHLRLVAIVARGVATKLCRAERRTGGHVLLDDAGHALRIAIVALGDLFVIRFERVFLACGFVTSQLHLGLGILLGRLTKVLKGTFVAGGSG